MSEVKLNKYDFLVSETDKAGVITFANEDFCKVSGYSLDELIGSPHSIVRHKDMPKSAFKDLWNTVKNGNIWQGFVKNATKSKGGFYWVFSTVYPTKNGYLSCRRMASEDEIKEAIALYETMN